MDLVRGAARNNALWCDAVCRAHGAPGELSDALWLTQHPVPRYYPNAVTLAGPEAAAEQVARLHELLDAGLPAGWGVKDSFAALDLTPLGFRSLFTASWIGLPEGRRLPPGPEEVRWERVEHGAALAAWEAAWGGPAEAGQPRLFLSSLLEDPDVAFLAGRKGGRIVGGAIVNRTGNVAGLSNVFAPAEAPERYWAGGAAAARRVFPGLPLVGYERGGDLKAALAAGFEVLGLLQVWVREAAAFEPT